MSGDAENIEIDGENEKVEADCCDNELVVAPEGAADNNEETEADHAACHQDPEDEISLPKTKTDDSHFDEDHSDLAPAIQENVAVATTEADTQSSASAGQSSEVSGSSRGSPVDDIAKEAYEPECDQSLKTSPNEETAPDLCELDPSPSSQPENECNQGNSNSNNIHSDDSSLPAGVHMKSVTSEQQEHVNHIQCEVQAAINQTMDMFESDEPSSDSGQASPAHVGEKSMSTIPKTESEQGKSENHSDMPVENSENRGIFEVSSSMKIPGDTVPCDKVNSSLEESEDALLSELDAELQEDIPPQLNPPNGLTHTISFMDIPEYKDLKRHCEQVEQRLRTVEEKNNSLSVENGELSQRLGCAISERDSYLGQVKELQSKGAEEIYMAQIKELENLLAQQQHEVKTTKDKLASHDAAAKRAVSVLQNELKLRVDQVTKMYEECLREKDSMVMKFAMGEAKLLEQSRHNEKLEKQIKDFLKEKDVMYGKMRGARGEMHKMAATVEAKNLEVNTLHKELEKMKEAISSQEVKTKWAQNKLRAELEAHKETKGKLEETVRKLKEAKEETMMIRRDCQAMIKTYQESEEIKSNSLDKELRKKVDELELQKQEKNDTDEVYNSMKRELDSIKKKHKETLEELKTWKDRVQCLNTEQINNEKTLNKYKEVLQNQKRENKEIKEKLMDLEGRCKELDIERETGNSLRAKLSEVEENNEDMLDDMETCRKKEKELLEFTGKISDKNAHLQSENSALETKVKTLAAEQSRLSVSCTELESRCAALASELSDVKCLRQEEGENLSHKLSEKTKAVEQLSIALDDANDDKKTLRRKHMANVKDLTRELVQMKKKLEGYEKPGEKDSMSQGSRTSSNGSLNTLENSHSHGNHSSNSTSRASSQEPPQDYCIVETIEVDKEMLMRKIVKLQKAHARKNEKLEFMEDHINQLLEEVQKKAKIIQSYVMREEAGALVPETMDINKPNRRSDVKAELMKKGGIMASLYNSHQLDGAMNLDLSLEINRKLQAVLEDVLLKNITLKENLETLGEEIARLSQQNRKLQLQQAH